MSNYLLSSRSADGSLYITFRPCNPRNDHKTKEFARVGGSCQEYDADLHATVKDGWRDIEHIEVLVKRFEARLNKLDRLERKMRKAKREPKG